MKNLWLKFRKKGGSIKLEYSQKICADAINVKIIVTKKSTGITRKSLVLISYGVFNALEYGKILKCLLLAN